MIGLAPGMSSCRAWTPMAQQPLESKCITVRHTLRMSGPLPSAPGLTAWYARQEKDKEAKYSQVVARLGWNFVPLVLDCYGGMGPQGRSLLATFVKARKGKRMRGRNGRRRPPCGRGCPSRWPGNWPAN